MRIRIRIKKLVGFVNSFGYLIKGVPSTESDRKHLKRLIDVPLLIGNHSHKDLRISFGKFETSLILLIDLLSFGACLECMMYIFGPFEVGT